MRIINTTLLLTYLLLFFPSASGAAEFLSVTEITGLSATALPEKYPDADDVILDDFIQVRYEPDGTSETWDDTALRILTEKGKRNNRTLQLPFNTSYGTNYFALVQIIKPDGTVLEIDPVSNSKVMINPAQMSANIYNPNSKITELSVPGLEEGDTLRYITCDKRFKTVVPDTWSDYQVFEHTSPIERTTYQVIAPKERPLVKIALKDAVPGTVSFNEARSEQEDRIVYTWKIRDVPRMFDEPNMPQRYTVVQRLLVSTMEEWSDLSKWYWQLCLPRLEATTPEMRAKALELTAGTTNTMDKIRAIFSFVSQDIRYMGITTEEEAPGYEPHDVNITFENRYGVCRDKAALLAAMLRLVDIEAFPVIIMAGPKKDEEVPQPFFNHAVTAAIDDSGDYVLMDSTDENTKDIFPSYLQNMSYIVARPEGDTLRTSPVIPAEQNLLKITSHGSLNRSGHLEAESTLVFEGINDTLYRGYLSNIKPEERRRFFEGHLKKTIPTAELKVLTIHPDELRDTTQPLTIRISYSAEDLLIKGHNNNMLNLPRLGSSLGYANFLIGQTGLEKRSYPLYNRVTAGISETLELDLPADAGNLHIPDYAQIHSDQVDWNMQVARQETRLCATNAFLLKTVEFSPEQYLGLKRHLKDIEYNLRKKLIFETLQNEEASSDVRILEQSLSIELEDTGRWKETVRTKAQILTYAGKKKYSEIKLAYNPAWQQIELTEAKVTLPDGSVKEISAEEKNIMDAAWVASAPRYPAEKILIASLPGVEIGSILEYEVVSTVNGKPFFSTLQTFNGHEAIDRKTFTLTAPESLLMKSRNTGIDESRSVSNGTVHYTWTAENQPAVKTEENLPAWWTFNPALFLSTGDWKSYAADIHEHLLQAAENQPAAEALARELTRGLNSKAEKATALRDWTSMHLRPAGPSLPELPFSAITPADRTLQDRYGNNTDRMVVLYALLKAARLKPQFVLSGGLSHIPEEAEPLLAVPSRNAFDSVLIRVEIDGSAVYLNGESQYAIVGTSPFHRRRMLDLAAGNIGMIEVAAGNRDRSHTILECSITDDGRAGFAFSSKIQGTAFETFHRTYAEMTPEARRRHYLELVADISQSAEAVSELITDYTDYPGKQSFSVAADRYAVADGEYLYFTVPAGLGGLLKYRSNDRIYPLAWSGFVDMIAEVNIILPDGYEPVILPKNFSWMAPGGGLIEVAVEYSESAHAVRMVCMADLKPALIPAVDFPEIIEAGRKLAHPDMNTVLLKRSE